jgi:cysteine synthase A
MGAVWANQFDNVANRLAHVEATGPEIWAQTGGKIDGFICAVGSGGTLGGISLYMKGKNPDVQIGLADPYGAALYSYYTTGELKSEGGSISEGIGQGRITANLEGIQVDRAYRVADEEWLPVLYDMIKQEGLCLGTSSALNVVGAMKMAKDLGPGKTIVTVLCDYGNRYASKIFNPAFLAEKGLPTPPWMPLAVAAE